MKQHWKDILEAFKNTEQEYAECVILLDENALLRNAFLGWRSMATKYDPEAVCDLNDDKQQWEWLWENTNFDYKHFAVLSGVKEYEVVDLVERLKAFHLIYPDGTCHKYGRAYLREAIRKKLPVIKDDKKKE